MPSLKKILEAEHHFNTLLPVERLQDRQSTELISAAGRWSQLVWNEAEQLGPMPLMVEQVTQGLLLAQNPVFICGVHRSGTTLLRDILDGHPDLVVLPSEGTFYTNQEERLQGMPETEWAGHLGKEWLCRLANPINQPPYWLLGRSTMTGSPYIDFARYLKAWWTLLTHQAGTQWPHMAVVLAYASCTGQLSAKLWVDKTPTNERFLKRIWKEMPAAKIIHMVRDPFATLASHKKMDPFGRLRLPLRYLKNSLVIAARQSAISDSRFLLLNYEELCNEPSLINKEISAFLNIERSDKMDYTSVAGIPSQSNSSFAKPAVAGLIIKPRVNQHAKFLKASEQGIIKAYLGKISAKHGYQLGKINSLHKLWLLIKYRLFI